MTTNSNIPARKIPWIEEPGGLQSTGSQRLGHDTTHSTMDQMLKSDNLTSNPSSATWQRDGLLFQPSSSAKWGHCDYMPLTVFKSNNTCKVLSI